MYDPVNMHIVDKERLIEKDQREKNKKARYEVRYDVEAVTRKEGLADQDLKEKMKLNKISGLRYKEETARGFDILTNEKLDGPATNIKMDQVSNSGPIKCWNNVLYNANANEKVQEQIRMLEQEEYYAKLKERGVTKEFKQKELEKLMGDNRVNPLQRTVYETRSRRLNSTINGGESAAPASKALSRHSQTAADVPKSHRTASHAAS
jgi:hypothetical protein